MYHLGDVHHLRAIIDNQYLNSANTNGYQRPHGKSMDTNTMHIRYHHWTSTHINETQILALELQGSFWVEWSVPLGWYVKISESTCKHWPWSTSTENVNKPIGHHCHSMTRVFNRMTFNGIQIHSQNNHGSTWKSNKDIVTRRVCLGGGLCATWVVCTTWVICTTCVVELKSHANWMTTIQMVHTSPLTT